MTVWSLHEQKKQTQASRPTNLQTRRRERFIPINSIPRCSAQADKMMRGKGKEQKNSWLEIWAVNSFDTSNTTPYTWTHLNHHENNSCLCCFTSPWQTDHKLICNTDIWMVYNMYTGMHLFINTHLWLIVLGYYYKKHAHADVTVLDCYTQ